MKTNITRRQSKTVTAAVCVMTATLMAGDYAIFWWTQDGGGGLSTGDDYALHGTFGQPDASESSGDKYTLRGGFWHPALPIMVQTDGAPVLFIRRLSADRARLFWMDDGKSYRLEESLNLKSGSWHESDHSVETVGREFHVTIPLVGRQNFFRLRFAP